MFCFILEIMHVHARVEPDVLGTRRPRLGWLIWRLAEFIFCLSVSFPPKSIEFPVKLKGFYEFLTANLDTKPQRKELYRVLYSFVCKRQKLLLNHALIYKNWYVTTINDPKGMEMLFVRSKMSLNTISVSQCTANIRLPTYKQACN
jgi:hypothetical protein